MQRCRVILCAAPPLIASLLLLKFHAVSHRQSKINETRKNLIVHAKNLKESLGTTTSSTRGFLDLDSTSGGVAVDETADEDSPEILTEAVLPGRFMPETTVAVLLDDSEGPVPLDTEVLDLDGVNLAFAATLCSRSRAHFRSNSSSNPLQSKFAAGSQVF